MFLDNGSLYHSSDTTHSFDSLSNAWVRPIRSTGRRLNGTVQALSMYGPASLLDNLSATCERARISTDMIHTVYDNRELSS